MSINATSLDDDSVIGEECHIVSPRPKGPRHKDVCPLEELDKYENLILLCRIHHKMIDDQCETYSIEVLKQIKKNHERWVSEKLTEDDKQKPIKIIRPKKSTADSYLARVISASDLLAIVSNAYGFDFDNEDLHSDDEVKMIGEFLQELQVYGDSSADLDPLEQVRAKKEIQDKMRELETKGFWIFAKREKAVISGGSLPDSSWPIAVIRIHRKSNQGIIEIELEN